MMIKIKTIFNAKREDFEKLGDNEYKIYFTKPLEKDKANIEVIDILSRKFGCSKSQIKIVKGFTSNEKTVSIAI